MDSEHTENLGYLTPSKWLRSGLITALVCCFLLNSCSGPSDILSVDEDTVRLMDIFPRLSIEHNTSDSKATPFEENSAGGKDVLQSSINLDFIKDSPAHPLKLKFTKIPANGSSRGNQTKNVILTPPPTTLGISLHLKRNYSLRFGFAVLGESWILEGEEVTFSIRALDLKTGAADTVYEKTIHPKNRASDRRWLRDSVDLSSFRGKNIRLEFLTGARRLPSWAKPRHGQIPSSLPKTLKRRNPTSF